MSPTRSRSEDHRIAAVATMEGPLVLADISGYTKFMATTELEHSDVLVRRMLNTIVASLNGRLEMAQLEGDAVFFVGEGVAPELIEWLEDSYLTFHRRMRRFLERRQCSCDACARAPELTLKLIAHYGRYSRQRIGETGQVHGVDVIVPHRLAKNSVPSREYILATRDLLERLPDALRASFVPHTEDAADLGRISLGYRDLTPLRDGRSTLTRRSAAT
jgi:class 3 adenylate cyclase